MKDTGPRIAVHLTNGDRALRGHAVFMDPAGVSVTLLEDWQANPNAVSLSEGKEVFIPLHRIELIVVEEGRMA